MANKPLKSIKFPELPDIYTIPQVDLVPTQGSSNAVRSGGVWSALQNIDVSTDTTLSVSGKPADAKAVGDALDAVEDDIKEIAGGLPEAQKNLIITILRNGLYSSDQSENINTLEDLFFADIPATSITLNASSISLIADSDENTYALTATVRPVYSTDAVIWTSSNNAVATVSDAGMVTGVSSGTAIITATAGNVYATCQVVVSADEINSISAVYTQSGAVYTTDALSVLKNDLVVTANYESGMHVVIPDYDYMLSGTLENGQSTITVTYAGKTTTFTVTVSVMTLDSIAYEDKTYRDIFITGNTLAEMDFETGLPSYLTRVAGTYEISSESCVSKQHSLKFTGTASQVKIANGSSHCSVESGKYYYDALNINCIRFDAGTVFGIFNRAKDKYLGVTAITDGWVTVSKTYTATYNGSFIGTGDVFIGSTGDPSIDGYMDDFVHISLTDMFTETPTKDTMDMLFERYCNLRRV